MRARIIWMAAPATTVLRAGMDRTCFMAGRAVTSYVGEKVWIRFTGMKAMICCLAMLAPTGYRLDSGFMAVQATIISTLTLLKDWKGLQPRMLWSVTSYMARQATTGP